MMCPAFRSRFLAAILLLGLLHASNPCAAQDGWLWSTAYAIPKETTSEQSGYFSIVEGKNGKLYIGTAKYGENSYLVEFDPATKQMQAVVDAQKEIGTSSKGFAAQAKIHTRNNVGESGKIYFGTKQGYAKEGESRTDYPGGYPMVYDPATGQTRVYKIPVPHHGVISITPDESRGVAYISTCSDERPIESSHFMKLDLETGEYQDLLDCQHMYAFIVLDHLGRAYHPILGGDIARYDPRTDRLERLKQTIDGQPPDPDSLLAHPESHPINWEVSPDRRTLYAVAMSGNQLYSYDLTAEGDTLPGRRLGKLIPSVEKTDCRALAVAPDGTVWAGVALVPQGGEQLLHLVSYQPGSSAPVDHGAIAISNPNYTEFTDAEGKAFPWHHGVVRLESGELLPRYTIMGICPARDGTVYVTTLYPFTLHAIRIPKIAGITTTYYTWSHAEVLLSRLLETESLDGQGRRPQLRLVSLYTDQVPENDISRPLAQKHQVPIFEQPGDALTLGGDRLAVDGVMLVAEHGNYPESETGQILYPKRRLFEAIVKEFEREGRGVPVFIDKHLADNWEDAHWIYQTARRLNVPLMAGSSLPVLWRYPPVDTRRDARLEQIVAVSYHRLDAYGFHALEMVQALAERRAGGETGVKAVQCLTGDQVWQAGREGRYDAHLLQEALARLKNPVPADKTLEQLVPEPVLFSIEYQDGLEAHILTLNGAVAEWSAAWRYADTDEVQSTLFWTQEELPFQHFTYLLRGIEQMMRTGQPAWPVERTLLTSGTLDALLISKLRGGERLETPHLGIPYQTSWNWQQPPEPKKTGD